jgi:hypothetical protein
VQYFKMSTHSRIELQSTRVRLVTNVARRQLVFNDVEEGRFVQTTYVPVRRAIRRSTALASSRPIRHRRPRSLLVRLQNNLY